MAIVKSALDTSRKGKVGNLRFSTQNGRIIEATQPGSYRDANTSVQKANRNGLKSLIWFSEFVANAYKSGFAKYKGIRSEYNVFVSKNKTASQASTDTEILPIVYANIVIADGPLSTANLLTIVPTSGTLDLTWQTTLIMPKDLATDSACVLIAKKLPAATAIEKIDYAQKEYFFANIATRDDGEATITIPPIINTADECVGYIFFKNNITKEASPSFYFSFTAG